VKTAFSVLFDPFLAHLLIFQSTSLVLLLCGLLIEAVITCKSVAVQLDHAALVCFGLQSALMLSKRNILLACLAL